MSVPGRFRAEVVLLLAHDLRRLHAAVGRPRPGVWISVLLPLALLAGAIAAAGPGALPDIHEPAGGVGLGFLVSAPLAFLAYGVLFRPGDDPFQRRLGIGGAAFYFVRALRLLGAALGVVLLLLIPFAVAGAPLAPPLGVLVGVAVAGWGAALHAHAVAADLTARPKRRPGIFSQLMGLDPELVKVGPLVYAPLAPLGVALVVGGWLAAGSGGAGWRVALAVLGGVGLAAAATKPFVRALPRFAPRALEMAYAPPPEAGETGLALDRGLPRLLPRRARAVWARDSVVTGRRFRWATGIVWPVAIVSVVALARWGGLPEIRTWVLAAGALTLAAQGAALIALGRLERSGPGWLDHATGLRFVDRWVGRCAFGFGLSLWLVVPLGLAWGLWAGTWSGWIWMMMSIIMATTGAAASLAAAGR